MELSVGNNQIFLALVPNWRSLWNWSRILSFSLAYTVHVHQLKGPSVVMSRHYCWCWGFGWQHCCLCCPRDTQDADPDSLAAKWLCTPLNLLCWTHMVIKRISLFPSGLHLILQVQDTGNNILMSHFIPTCLPESSDLVQVLGQQVISKADSKSFISSLSLLDTFQTISH